MVFLPLFVVCVLYFLRRARPRLCRTVHLHTTNFTIISYIFYKYVDKRYERYYNMNTHNYRLCAAYLQAPGRMWVSVREKHAFPPRGGREDVGQVRGNVRGKQKIWDGRAGEARQEEKIMSKAKRIVL
ncbi:MAG TPA: hypothetical protein H9726_05250, partial [Candidatus Borkfalkia avicola]|nr:hypothetical protein [Candidatus Borkfalkia avicola]